MEKENKKPKLKFRTCIEAKPILSTMKRVGETKNGIVNGNDIWYEMQVKVEGQMTAYCYNDAIGLGRLFMKDGGQPKRGRGEISAWLRDAIASGEIEIELINEPLDVRFLTDQEYECYEQAEWRKLDEEKERNRPPWLKSAAYNDGQSDREMREDTRSAYDGADGIDFDGEAM